MTWWWSNCSCSRWHQSWVLDNDGASAENNDAFELRKYTYTQLLQGQQETKHGTKSRPIWNNSSDFPC